MKHYKILHTSMKKFTIEVKKGRFHIRGSVQEIGADLLVSLWGGTRPHIGAVGMAVPRPSLKNPRKWSATSSNFTFVGHKEDMIVKKVSETLSSRLQKNVVVTAGLHWENMSSREIETVEKLTGRLSEEILNKLEKQK